MEKGWDVSGKTRVILSSLAVGLAIQPDLTGIETTILQDVPITVIMEADIVCREVGIGN